MSELMKGRRETSGDVKEVKLTETREILVVICGEQSDGTITPVLVDSDGKIITTTGAE